MDNNLFRCGLFRILPLLCLFFGIQTVQADIIQGRVLDAETHEPLYGAHVEVTEEVPDLCTVKWVRYTDSLGCFTYSCCGGSRLTFRARFLGYKTNVVRMKGTDAGDTIHIDDILLQPSEVLLKEGIDLGPAADKKTQLFAPADVPALPSFVVRLSDDVMQFAEAPHDVVVIDKDGQPLKAGDPHRFFEASWMHKYNGKYYFSYSTGDSHMLCYAIGDNPYGPFTYQGVILDPVVGWTTHHSIVKFKDEWFLFYHDCVPSNDITHLRSLKVQRLFYNEDGTIQKVINE